MFDRQTLRAGTQIFIATPKSPMQPRQAMVLRDAILREPNVAFAYTPLVYMPDRMREPRQVLYLVLRESARGKVEEIVASLTAVIHLKWDGDYIDVLPVFPGHSLLATVLGTRCLLAVNDEVAHQKCIDAAREVDAHRKGSG